MSGPTDPARAEGANDDLAALIGNRWSLDRIARAMGCTERAVYKLIDRYHIPYIKLLSRRYIDPTDIQAAVLRKQANTGPRGRGRPRGPA